MKKLLYDVLFPRRCVICDGILKTGEEGVCSICHGELECIEDNYCMKCGKPVEQEKELCGDCEKKRTTFIQGRCAFVYNHAMQKSMSRFKNGGRQEYAEFYGKAIATMFSEWIETRNADVLIPVPIHRERRKKRGYNQAELLAEEIGKWCAIPVCKDYLYRIKNTIPQKELTEKERLYNLNSAFRAGKKGGKLNTGIDCAIIVDDIFTTGSTMEACARELYRQGIHRIYFLCACIGKGF